MIKITKAQSKSLNRKIKEAGDGERHDLFLKELVATGKIIPYMGKDWQEVDFTKPICLGHCVRFVGFLEDNKWNYPKWQLSEEQDSSLKMLLLDLDLNQPESLIELDLQDIYRCVQSCCPDNRDVEWEALEAISQLVADESKTEGGIHARCN